MNSTGISVEPLPKPLLDVLKPTVSEKVVPLNMGSPIGLAEGVMVLLPMTSKGISAVGKAKAVLVTSLADTFAGVDCLKKKSFVRTLHYSETIRMHLQEQLSNLHSAQPKYPRRFSSSWPSYSSPE